MKVMSLREANDHTGSADLLKTISAERSDWLLSSTLSFMLRITGALFSAESPELEECL